MVQYREATAEDAEPIAQLHTLSWQQNYRGMLSDEFLSGPVLENRQAVWQERLKQSTSDQYIIVAESEGAVVGFACAYLNEHPVWGTLLDNLHVHPDQKGQGVGIRLIRLVASWSYDKKPEVGFYLWVLPQNTSARKFYEHLGAVHQKVVSHKRPDGGRWDACRYVWTDVNQLR